MIKHLGIESSEDCFFYTDNLNPGDKYQKTIEINNIGNTDLKVYLEKVVGSTDSLLLSQLKLKILSEDGTVLFYNDFNNINYILLGTLEKNSTKTFTVIFEFDSGAGNEYQGVNIYELLIFTPKTTDFEPPKPTPTPVPTSSPVSTPTPTPTPNHPYKNTNMGDSLSNESSGESRNDESSSSNINYNQSIGNNQNVDNSTNYETGVAGDMDQNLINGVTNCCHCNCWWWHLITVVLLVVILLVLIFKNNDKKDNNDKNKKDENK